MRDVFNVGCVECDICGVWMECDVRIWDVCSVGGVQCGRGAKCG